MICSGGGYGTLTAQKLFNKTQLKLLAGMRYKGVTQRCCPWLLLRSGNNFLYTNDGHTKFYNLLYAKRCS